jgi:hypothetical protein
MTSPDGITWTTRSDNDGYWIGGVAYGNSTYVAVGGGQIGLGTVLTSQNGSTWTNNGLSISNYNPGTDPYNMYELYGVTYAKNMFVAVGSRLSTAYGLPELPAVLVSSDGVTWTREDLGYLSGFGLSAIIYENNTFVAMGGNGTAMTSSDGLNWATYDSGANSPSSLAFGNGTFVAVGAAGSIVASLAGVTWASCTSGTSNDLYGVAYGHNTFVAVGENGTILQSGVLQPPLIVTSSPSSVPADGSSVSTVTAVYQDAYGNPVSGAVINFSTDLGTLSSSSAVTDSTGVASVTVKSATAGTATVTATVYALTATTQVDFVPLGGSVGVPANIILTASPSTGVEVGQPVNVTATVTDSSGAPLSNQTITFSLSGSAYPLSTSAPTNDKGQTAISINDNVPEPVTITPQVSNKSIGNPINVQWHNPAYIIMAMGWGSTLGSSNMQPVSDEEQETTLESYFGQLYNAVKALEPTYPWLHITAYSYSGIDHATGDPLGYDQYSAGSFGIDYDAQTLHYEIWGISQYWRNINPNIQPKYVLIGHSLGGLVIQQYLHDYQTDLHNYAIAHMYAIDSPLEGFSYASDVWPVTLLPEIDNLLPPLLSPLAHDFQKLADDPNTLINNIESDTSGILTPIGNKMDSFYDLLELKRGMYTQVYYSNANLFDGSLMYTPKNLSLFSGYYNIPYAHKYSIRNSNTVKSIILSGITTMASTSAKDFFDPSPEYSYVFLAKTVQPDSPFSLTTTTFNDTPVTLTGESDTFSAPLTVTITGAQNGDIQRFAPDGQNIFTAVGVSYNSTPQKPMTLVINSPAITSTTEVWKATSSGLAQVTNAIVSPGSVTISFTTDPDFVLSNPIPPVTVAPLIASAVPIGGSQRSLSLFGVNFGSTQGSSTVTIAGSVAQATYWSGSQINVTVPSGVSSGNIIVTVNGSPSNPVPYPVPPVLSSITPSMGVAGTEVTISGAGFGANQTPDDGVYVGTQKITQGLTWSDTQITCLLPSGIQSGTSVDIFVYTDGGLSNPAVFTITQPASGVYSQGGGGGVLPQFAVSTTSLSAATVGERYNVTISTNDEGTAPYAFSLTSGSLPPGLALDASTGTISGTPTTAGTYTFTVAVKDKNNNSASESYALTVKPGTPVMPPITPKVTLKDISGFWAEANIEKLVSLGAISGYPDGTFRPNNDITRAEFVTVLVKALKLPPRTGPVFADTEDNWAKDYISTAVAYGIVKGYDSTHFGPNELITREQMTAMVVRAAKLAAVSGELTFKDAAQIDSWARGDVVTAVKDGIIHGYPDDTFRPLGYATRAEAVTVIAGLVK